MRLCSIAVFYPGTFGTSGSLAARRGSAAALPVCKDARGVPLTQEELQAWLPVCTCAICTGRSQRKWLAANEARKKAAKAKGPGTPGAAPLCKKKRSVFNRRPVKKQQVEFDDDDVDDDEMDV